MELTHRLTYNNQTTVIDEPIGFDSMQVHMQRHDYHGMGVESTLDSLEFYGAAFGIIKTAYEADIDSEVTYSIIGGSETIYQGNVDLSTCSFVNGDYQSVKAKVGETGVMTTFNNRTDVDIDVDDPKTVDGESVANPEWMSLEVPMKHLLYTNKSEQKVDGEEINGTNTGSIPSNPYPETGIMIDTSGSRHLFIPIGVDTVSEFGQLQQQNPPIAVEYTSSVSPQYVSSPDHEEKFGQGTEAQIEIALKATMTNKTMLPDNTGYVWWHLAARDANDNVINGDWHKIEKSVIRQAGSTFDLSCSLTGTLAAGNSIKYYLEFNIDIPSGDRRRYIYVTLVVQKGSYVKMTMYDKLPETVAPTKMLLVHDALNVVSHAISENALSVKSDWYRTPESQWEAGTTGSGAMKALTNGYKIRDLFTDGEYKRNMPLSFKSLIESLDAMDCVGWGFSRESGNIYMRVERWDWFYKNETVITLTDVAEVTRDVYADRIPTSLTIGYKKFATEDQYNSIESPHGKRTFTNGIKALSKALTKESDFIADNYAIEETRRARTQKNATEESSYDENIFVFEIKRYKPFTPIGQEQQPAEFSIPHTAHNAVNVGRAEEFINAKLTPRHMAARWRDYIFATNNSTPFRFTSGEINYKASFSTKPEDFPGDVNSYYLGSMAITSPQVENDDITYTHAKFKAEKITFSCPISREQYSAVKANPYGLVSVNGQLGWIIDFKYSLSDGMTDFTLIAKN
jgi:hypothetical protein